MLEMQEKLLGLLKEVDEICRNNGIEYYLTGGSLIGAMRHKGFIPWDDDADILMTRDNFLRFVDVYDKCSIPERRLYTQYKGVTSTTVAHYVVTSNVDMYRQDIPYPEPRGTTLDIIIADWVHDTKEDRDKYIYSVVSHEEITKPQFLMGIRYDLQVPFDSYIERAKKQGIERVLDEIDKEAFNNKKDECELLGQCFANAIHFWRKEDYGHPIYVPFEDTYLPVPSNPNSCLCVGYNEEWFFIPQVNNNELTTHNFCVRVENVNPDCVFNDFKRRVDYKELSKVYFDRKSMMIKNMKETFDIAINDEMLADAYIRYIYSKDDSDELMNQLSNGDYESIEKYFDKYLKVQCTSFYLGSSTLSGWKNWYRKQNPKLIDIGDDKLHVCLRLLIQKEKYRWANSLLKARKRENRALTDELKTIENELAAVKVSYDLWFKQDYVGLKSHLEKNITEYDDNLTLYKFCIKLNIEDSNDYSERKQIIEKALQKYPNDYEILCEKYLCEMDESVSKETLFELLLVVKDVNNGIVLTRIKEKLEHMDVQGGDVLEKYNELSKVVKRQLGHQVDESEEILTDNDGSLQDGEVDAIGDEKSDEYGSESSQYIDAKSESDYQVNDNVVTLKDKHIELLCEFDAICRKNEIKYTLWGNTLAQAVQNHALIDENGGVHVAMRYNDAKRFQSIVNNSNLGERFCDSIDTNDSLPRYVMRYGDNGTLDISKGWSQLKKNAGVFITIELLYCPIRNKNKEHKLERLLQGWNLQLGGKCDDDEKYSAYLYVKKYSRIFGRKYIAKKIYKLVENESKHYTNVYKHVNANGKFRLYKSKYFEEYRNVELNNFEFMAVDKYNYLLRSLKGERWKKKIISITNVQPTSRIIDLEVNNQDFLQFLDKQDQGVDRLEQRMHVIENKHARTKYKELTQRVNYYWELLRFCGDRYYLKDYYDSKKNYIMRLYHNKENELLFKELYEYRIRATHYIRYGMALCFDKELFEALMYVWEWKEKQTVVDAMREKLNEEDYICRKC